MEMLNERIKGFLTLSFGPGLDYDNVSGNCYGKSSDDDAADYGLGCGCGCGFNDAVGLGSGFGCGDGNSCGYGDGCGYDIKIFNGYTVYVIDEISTVITAVCGNIAKGFIINTDLTTQPCFIVKGQDMFAHGETIVEAQRALQEKIVENMDTDEKIALFLSKFKAGIKYPAKLFYDWHHNLTGSCKFGRDAFVRNHGIDLESGMYTVEEFIEYTKNEFGSEIIKQLDKEWKIRGNERQNLF